MMQKLTSRKFLLCLAAFLFSLGTGIAGLSQGNETLAMAGGTCCVVSTALYAACEAYVDGKACMANQTMYTYDNSIQRSVTANANDKAIVGNVLAPEPEKVKDVEAEPVR